MTVEEFRERHLPDLVRRLGVTRAIAFGSRVRGDSLETSDLDVVLVSEAFEGVFFTDRIARALEVVGVTDPIDLLRYTPREFEKKSRQIGIVGTAAREGIALLGG